MAVKEGKELSPKWLKFADEYLVDLNGAQAAIRAGYSEKTARSIANRLLTYVDIQEYIQKRRKEIQKSLQITQERILEEEARLAFVDVRFLFDENGDLLPIHKIPEDARRAIAGVEITDLEKVKGVKRKYRLSDKGRALERISKHLGLYAAKKHEHTGKDGGPIETKITDFPKEPATIKEWEEQRKEAEEHRENNKEEG